MVLAWRSVCRFTVICGLLLAAAAAGGKVASVVRADAGGRKGWFEALAAARAAEKNVPENNRQSMLDLGASDWTFSAWIRTKSNGAIFAKLPLAGRDRACSKLIAVHNGHFYIETLYTQGMFSRQRVDDGQWHHVALTREAAKPALVMYVDGQRQEMRDRPIDRDRAEHFIRIGRGFDGYPDPTGFTGDLDEMCLFDRALGDADIAALAQGPQTIAATGLIARWSFEGDTRDISGRGHDAGDSEGITYVAGRVGKAAHLDGNSWIQIPTTPAQRQWFDLYKQFPDAASQSELRWELADGIWFHQLDPKDLAEIARRYARATRTGETLIAEAHKITKEPRTLDDVRAARQVYLQSRRRAEVLAGASGAAPEALRKAIAGLTRDGVLEPARAAEFNRRLDAADAALADLQNQPQPNPAASAKLAGELAALQKESLLQNKLMDFDKLVFIRRYTFQSNHYYTDFINGCAKFGGNICILNRKDNTVTELLPEKMSKGIVGRMDLSFDATKIVFAWKEEPSKGFRIWEVGVDGSGLRQLTFPPENEEQLVRDYRLGYHHGTDDMDPCYLPDGGICFISTRCQYGILCDSPDDFTTTVLYRMDADGKNIQKLSNSSVSEASPCVMNDGRIMYTRWEYVDKGSSAVKCLWSMRPDGTGSAEIYGNDINLPPSFIQGRPIPGQNNLFVVLGAPHFPGNRVGTVIRVDTTKDIRTREPMTYITPNVDIRGEGGWCHLINGNWEGSDRGPMYAEPFPLSASTYLVSYNPDKFWADFSAYGLYLLDEYGNHVPLYKDPEISCWQPTPLRPRVRPPVLQPGTVNRELAEKKLAAVIVTDVYGGLEGIDRGTVKYLRINEQVPRPWAARRHWDGDLYDQQHACISKHGALGLRVQHGVVPVEPDGSAYFLVPADRNIFIQALDENYMEVQRERTFVNYRPGETRSCVGCHEHSDAASRAASSVVMALRKSPVLPGPQPGEKSGARPLYYPTDVQPVLDAKCISCHNPQKAEGKLDLTGEMTELFSRSYENLVDRGMLQMINEVAPKCDNINYLPPKSLGSPVSKLVALLQKGHYDVKLTREEMIRITTWVDANGQYYGSYYGRRNIKYKDMPDFRPVPTLEQATSTELPAGMKTWPERARR